MQFQRYVRYRFRYLLDEYLFVPFNQNHKNRYKSLHVEASDIVSDWKENLARNRFFLDFVRLELNPDSVIARCDAILRHEFTILGQRYLGVESAEDRFQSIPWHYDPSSGYTWSQKVWYRHSRRNLPQGVDIKLPWELSRCQHFTILGEGYALTKDERYAQEFTKQIRNWIEANPVRYGPNWECTMEVGIRIANWLVGLLYFYESPSLTESFYLHLLPAVEQHGRHIMANLERASRFTSNHYMGNISGLFFLATLCPVLSKSQKWKNFANKELEKEIFEQTLRDGWDFESSTTYHRLVLEMLLYSFFLSESDDRRFSANFVRRLRAMLQALNVCMKPNNHIPQIGDNDSGRFLVFNVDNDIDSLDVSYLIQQADHHPQLHLNGAKCGESASFMEAGRYFLKSGRIYFAIAAGLKGQKGSGGHAHNDVLSYELNVDGRDIFVDPGTYLYTPDPIERNKFRSISSHNTLYWEGLEPCGLGKGLFVLREEGILSVEKVELTGEADQFVGLYKYAGRFHHREISFDKERQEIVVKDTCSHEGAYLSFVCAPDIFPECGQTCFVSGPVEVHFDRAKSIKVVSFSYSPAYGVIVPTHKIVVRLIWKEITHRITLKNVSIA